MLGQIFDAKELTQRLKATVQRTGKLGFTAETLDVLQIKQDGLLCIIYKKKIKMANICVKSYCNRSIWFKKMKHIEAEMFQTDSTFGK